MAQSRSGPLTRWRSFAGRLRTHLQVLKDPVVEQQGPALNLAHSCLEALSPFYLLLDSRGMAVASGASLRLFLQGAGPHGAQLCTLFVERDGEDGLQLSSAPLHALEGRLLRLEATARPGLEFAGQLIPLWSGSQQDRNADPSGHWILDLRPILETLEDLEASGLSLQDLSLLDPMRVSMVTMLMDASLRQELLNGLCGGM